MTQQQSVPDPELFTKEIEDTIDSLFTPTKEIEIDPVTNEVKEVKRKEAAPQPKPEEKATLAIEEGEEEELTLELEEEPEKAEELEGAPEEIPEISLSEEEAPEPTAPEGPVETMEHQFNQLYQSLLTLEWEITKEDLTSAHEILKSIAQKMEAVGSKDAELLITSMLRIMNALREDPEAVSPNAPKALEMGLEAVMAIAREKDQPTPETVERVKKAKEFMALVRFGEEAKQEQETLTKETVSMVSEPELSESTLAPELNVDRLQAVIDDLSNLVERIIPIQELLKKHRKSQKLYKFLLGIRSGIESSIEVLSQELGLEVPEIKAEQVVPRDMVTGFTTEISQEPPPFKELLVFQWSGAKVALLPEEVAYVGPVLGFGKKVKVSDGVFSLNALRKWPWSKVKNVVEGELKQLDEAKLRSLTLPIVSRPDLEGESAKGEEPRLWILLYRDDKGAAIAADTPPEKIAVKKTTKWLPEKQEDSKWLGSLSIEDEVVRVFSLERVFETL